MDVVQTFCMGSSPTMMKHVDTTHTNDETCHVDLNPQKHGMKLWFTDVGYPKIFASHPSCGPKSLALYSRSTTPMALQDAASPSWLSILMGGIPAIKTWVLCYWFTLWKTNSLLWKITIFNGKIHYKWPFSIAMLVYQRVLTLHIKEELNTWKIWWRHYRTTILEALFFNVFGCYTDGERPKCPSPSGWANPNMVANEANGQEIILNICC